MPHSPLMVAACFAGLDEAACRSIYKAGEVRTYPRETVLFRQGEPAQRSFFVLTGRLKLSRLHPDGKEVLVRYINTGEITAEIAVFSGKDYPVSAETLEESRVLAWNRANLRELMQTHARLTINMLEGTIERLEDIQRRYLELHAERVEKRIGLAVLRIMKQSGRKTDEGILIDFRLSRQDLADYTGTTVYTVSRTLRGWEKKGWVKSGRERLVVTDAHALVAFVEMG